MQVTRERLYPYLVPEPYLKTLDPGPDGFIPLFGHDVYTLLVVDGGNFTSNVQLDELRELHLDVESAHRIALENLRALARTDQIRKDAFIGPMDRQFIGWSGHWLAASCLRLPGLGDWARKTLGVDEVCASIPQRETLLIFPMADRLYRDTMRQMIKKSEEHARKQVTWELFKFDGDRVCAFTESS